MNKSCYLFEGEIVKQFALFSDKFTQLLKNFTRPPVAAVAPNINSDLPLILICSLRGKRSVPAEMTLASRNSPAGLLTESVTKTTFTETTVIIGDNNDVDDGDIENGPD